MYRSGNPSAVFRRLATCGTSTRHGTRAGSVSLANTERMAAADVDGVRERVSHYQATGSLSVRDGICALTCRAYNEYLCDLMGWSCRVGTLTLNAAAGLPLTACGWSGPSSELCHLRAHVADADRRLQRLICLLDLDDVVNFVDISHAFGELAELVLSGESGATADGGACFCAVTVPPRKHNDDAHNALVESAHDALRYGGASDFAMAWKRTTYANGAVDRQGTHWPTHSGVRDGKARRAATLVCAGGVRQHRGTDEDGSLRETDGVAYTVYVCKFA